VRMAYHHRRHNLAKVADEDDLSRPEPKPEQQKLHIEELQRIIQTDEGTGLTFHTFADVGRYTVFPDAHYKRMFPRKSFGNVDVEDYPRNKTRGIMTREEGLRFTNELHRLTLPSQRNIEYGSLAHDFTNQEVRHDFLQDD